MVNLAALAICEKPEGGGADSRPVRARVKARAEDRVMRDCMTRREDNFA